MKKVISMLLCAVMALSLLAGCGTKNDETVTLSIWHVYGSQTESPLNDVIDEFNATVGQEQHIFVNVTSVTDSGDIDEMLTAALTKQPGAMSLPDLFTAYPRVQEQFGAAQLLDWSQYMKEDELTVYRQDFLSEGWFGDKLLMLPIAKSSELLFVNRTLFDDFSADTGVTMDCFGSMDSLLAACDVYYDWSDGKLNADSDAFAAVFTPVAQAAIYGGLCVGDGTAAAMRFNQGYDGVAMGIGATLLISGVQAQMQACRG